MFVGHFGVALAAKRLAPRTSLATLVAGASFLDLLWPALLLAGVERVRIVPEGAPFLRFDFESYPYSHSALWVAGWALAFGLVYLWRTGYRRGAVVAAALVASHWILDVATHVPDLPVWPGGPKMGFGLWRSLPATLVVELAIFFGGIAVYLGATRARRAAGSWGFAGWIAMLLFFYVSSLFAPAPPGVAVIGVSALVGSALTLAWAARVDRAREARGSAMSSRRPAA